MEKMDMVFYRKLPTPKEVKEQYPVGTAVEKLKAERDRIIRNIFEGKGRPMSAHYRSVLRRSRRSGPGLYPSASQRSG